jgi:prepilin-type N-terminal cleavage/methylation domain-containing protein
MSKIKGFSLYELMISVFILALIAGSTVINLRNSRYKDELNNGVRALSADLKTLQNKALTGQNIKSCLSSDGKRAVCENSTAYCQDAATCTAAPPYAVGARFERNKSTYTLFAEVDQTMNDWKWTEARETVQVRDLAAVGAPNVAINRLFRTAGFVDTTDVAFQRQNGSTGIDACFPPCMTSYGLSIILRHNVTGQERTVSVYTVTGSISFE